MPLSYLIDRIQAVVDLQKPAARSIIRSRESSRKELIMLMQNQVTTERTNALQISMDSSSSSYSEHTESDMSDQGPLSHRNRVIISTGEVNHETQGANDNSEGSQ